MFKKLIFITLFVSSSIFLLTPPILSDVIEAASKTADPVAALAEKILPPGATPKFIPDNLFQNMTADPILSSVLVSTETGGGSGAVLNSLFVLTAYHVVDNATSITIEFPYTDITCTATVEAFGNLQSHDFAILRLQGGSQNNEGGGGIIDPDLQPVDFRPLYYAKTMSMQAFSSLSTNDSLYTVGYPLGLPIHIDYGVLCSSYKDYYITGIPIIFGNSGGPVFTDDDEIAGVMVRVAGTGFSVICHISYMTKFSNIFEDLEAAGQLYTLTGQNVPAKSPQGPYEPKTYENSFDLYDSSFSIHIQDIPRAYAAEEKPNN